MKRFNNTPGPHGGWPQEKPKRTGQALVDWLEDNYADFRQAGYQTDNAALHADYKKKIQEAKASL